MITREEIQEIRNVIDNHRELYGSLEEITYEIKELQEKSQKIFLELEVIKDKENFLLESLRKKYNVEITPEFILKELHEYEQK